MSFKIASNKEQARLRRTIPKKFGDFDVDPSIEEKIENLHAIRVQLEEENRVCFVPARKAIIGQRIQDILQEIASLKPVRKSYGKDFPNVICNVIKAEVTPAQWKIWLKKAEAICERPVSDQATPEKK